MASTFVNMDLFKQFPRNVNWPGVVPLSTTAPVPAPPAPMPALALPTAPAHSVVGLHNSNPVATGLPSAEVLRMSELWQPILKPYFERLQQTATALYWMSWIVGLSSLVIVFLSMWMAVQVSGAQNAGVMFGYALGILTAYLCVRAPVPNFAIFGSAKAVWIFLSLGGFVIAGVYFIVQLIFEVSWCVAGSAQRENNGIIELTCDFYNGSLITTVVFSSYITALALIVFIIECVQFHTARKYILKYRKDISNQGADYKKIFTETLRYWNGLEPPSPLLGAPRVLYQLPENNAG